MIAELERTCAVCGEVMPTGVPHPSDVPGDIASLAPTWGPHGHRRVLDD